MSDAFEQDMTPVPISTEPNYEAGRSTSLSTMFDTSEIMFDTSEFMSDASEQDMTPVPIFTEPYYEAGRSTSLSTIMSDTSEQDMTPVPIFTEPNYEAGRSTSLSTGPISPRSKKVREESISDEQDLDILDAIPMNNSPPRNHFAIGGKFPGALVLIPESKKRSMSSEFREEFEDIELQSWNHGREWTATPATGEQISGILTFPGEEQQQYIVNDAENQYFRPCGNYWRYFICTIAAAIVLILTIIGLIAGFAVQSRNLSTLRVFNTVTFTITTLKTLIAIISVT